MKVLVLLAAFFALIIVVSSVPLPYPRAQRFVPVDVRAKRASLPVDSAPLKKTIEAEESLEGSESAYPPYIVYPYYVSHLPVVYVG